jgi:hypothetical protein
MQSTDKSCRELQAWAWPMAIVTNGDETVRASNTAPPSTTGGISHVSPARMQLAVLPEPQQT